MGVAADGKAVRVISQVPQEDLMWLNSLVTRHLLAGTGDNQTLPCDQDMPFRQHSKGFEAV